MVKLIDVARHAGVGVGTASRAMTGRGAVDASTRARVLASAEALGYRPNSVAKALREQRTGVVGLLLPDINNNFYTASAAVLQAELSAAGYELLVATTRDDPSAEDRALRAMTSRQVEGIVHVPTALHLSTPSSIPTVQLNRHSSEPGVHAVVSDDVAGVRRLTEHVLDSGHSDLAVIVGPQDLSTSRDRVEGFRTAAHGRARRLREIVVPLSPDGGQTAMAELADDLPGAVVVLSGRLLLGVLRSCRDLRLAIPHDLSVAAYGGPDWYDVWTPGITAYEPPLEEMGRAAAGRLLDLIQSPEANAGVHRIDGVVTLRGSVADLTG